MSDGSVDRGSENPFFIIFTDLDGTLLDRNTYGWEEAKPALTLCKRLKVPIILASSKTRAEIEVLRHKLSIYAPFISENGGGIFSQGKIFKETPPGASFNKGLWKWSLGVPYSRLIEILQEIKNELGLQIRGFSEMSTEEISCLTGLDLESSRLASMREFDEPFIVPDQNPDVPQLLFNAAAKRGVTVIAGGRFYHLQGKNNKGIAMAKVISWYGKTHENVRSIALGDSPNDFSMLEQADLPVLVRSPKKFSELKKRIPGLRVTTQESPGGWNSAIMDILG